MKKTALAVAVFVVLLLIAGCARAESGVRIGLGKSIVNAYGTVGEIGYEYNDWELSATLIGDEQTEVYSVSYLTRPIDYKPAQPFLRLGVSYNSGSHLVGDSNFRLGVGVDFSDVWRLEYVHHSSAGIHKPNTGIDYVVMTYKMPAPWE